jgi:hypothetical protein
LLNNILLQGFLCNPIDIFINRGTFLSEFFPFSAVIIIKFIQAEDNMGKLILAIGLSIVCIALVYGCSDKGENVISGNGSIIYQSLEGGCWGITMDDGNRYGFLILPEAFQQVGLRVRISAKLSEPYAAYCKAADIIIDIIDIRRI